MNGVAGQVADGVHVHPMHSMHYIQNRLLPEVTQGAEIAGRDPSEIDLIVPVFAVAGDSPEERAPWVHRAKTQIAFYGTTPNYAFQFEDLGFDGITKALGDKMKAGDLQGMADTISDEMLDHFALVSPWDEMADRLKDRYASTASRVVMYLTEEHMRKDPESIDKWGEVARATRS